MGLSSAPLDSTAPSHSPQPGMREFSLDTDFGRLAALRTDAAGAPRVLALHGWLDNAASFLPLQPHLAGIELVALDLPGHGASAHLPFAAQYTVPNTARAVLAAADALGWTRFSLLGHSLGGVISSVLAAAVPARIDRLLVIESLGALAEAEERTAARLQDSFARGSEARSPLRVFDDPAHAVRARVLAGGIGAEAAALLVERGIAPARSEDRQPGFSWRSDPRLTRATAVRMTEGQVHDLLRAIECPTRVIYADPAQSYFPEPLRRARFDCLRHGELVVMPGGHHLHMEQAIEVAAAIGDFFIAGA